MRRRTRPLDAGERRAIRDNMCEVELALLSDESDYCLRWPDSPLSRALAQQLHKHGVSKAAAPAVKKPIASEESARVAAFGMMLGDIYARHAQASPSLSSDVSQPTQAAREADGDRPCDPATFALSDAWVEALSPRHSTWDRGCERRYEDLVIALERSLSQDPGPLAALAASAAAAFQPDETPSKRRAPRGRDGAADAGPRQQRREELADIAEARWSELTQDGTVDTGDCSIAKLAELWAQSRLRSARRGHPLGVSLVSDFWRHQVGVDEYFAPFNDSGVAQFLPHDASGDISSVRSSTNDGAASIKQGAGSDGGGGGNAPTTATTAGGRTTKSDDMLWFVPPTTFSRALALRGCGDTRGNAAAAAAARTGHRTAAAQPSLQTRSAKDEAKAALEAVIRALQAVIHALQADLDQLLAAEATVPPQSPPAAVAWEFHEKAFEQLLREEIALAQRVLP
jgi:hypothetical protein